MKLALALGVAFAALTVVANAEPERQVFVYQEVLAGGQDADDDGWVSRAEASNAADRMFAEMDRNDDGRLDDADWPSPEDFDIHIDGDDAPHGEGERTVIIRRDHDAAEHETDRRVERRIERRVVDGGDGDAVIIQRDGHELEFDGPIPAPPHPPVFMAMSANAQEFDRNGDGALSQEEFRSQQLRYFDASDGNGDSRVRAAPPMHWEMALPEPPEPPTPPVPPTPPTPPRRR